MFAHRCIECTLFRCDSPGEACGECLVNVSRKAPKATVLECNVWTIAPITFGGMPSPTPPVPKPAPAGLAVPASTQQAPKQSTPNPLVGGIATLIPGDFRHNAAQMATFLMAIPWSSLKSFAAAQGFPAVDYSKLHDMLCAYANSP